MTNSKELANVNEKFEVESSLKRIQSTVQNSVICKSNCKLCNSQYRLQVQKMCDQGRTMKYIHAFLVENKQDISYKAVNNHFQQHYSRQKTQIQMKEYLQDLTQYQVQKQNRTRDLLDRKGMFNKMLVQMAARHDTLTDLQQMRKNASALKTINDSIINIQTQIDIINKQSQPVVLILQKLTQIARQISQGTDNQQVKMALNKFLKQLSAECQGLWVNS